MEEHPFTFFSKYLPGVTHENLHVATAAFVALILILAAFLLFPKLRKISDAVVPDHKFTLRSFFEIFLEMLATYCDEIIGHDGRKYLSFVGTIFLFIFFCNLIGLVPGFLPATENWVTGAAVATISFIAYNYFGIREHGLGYFKHFFAPLSPGKGVLNWVLLIIPLAVFQAGFAAIEVVSSLFRPITLSVRLYANIFADHQVLSIFSHLVPFGVPVLFMLFGLFVSFMQAFVFTLLTIVYISGAVAHGHDD